jgi:hypothetical protein
MGHWDDIKNWTSEHWLVSIIVSLSIILIVIYCIVSLSIGKWTPTGWFCSKTDTPVSEDTKDTTSDSDESFMVDLHNKEKSFNKLVHKGSSKDTDARSGAYLDKQRRLEQVKHDQSRYYAKDVYKALKRMTDMVDARKIAKDVEEVLRDDAMVRLRKMTTSKEPVLKTRHSKFLDENPLGFGQSIHGYHDPMYVPANTYLGPALFKRRYDFPDDPLTKVITLDSGSKSAHNPIPTTALGYGCDR